METHFILKPSEKDPSCSIKLAQLFKEAGLPDGVFNVVNGDKEAVDALLTNKDVAAISFVGSTPIAKYIYENAAKNEKRVQALGGAKNHCVVMPDCDLDQAVNGLMGAAYGSAGERCMAQSVAVAVGKIGNQLVTKLAKKVESLKVGPGLDKNSEMGPLVTKQHLEKVKGYVDLGVQEGAKLVVDGRNIKLQGYEKGFYIGGCLFDNVDKKMRIYKEEIFGPVLSVVRVEDFESAVDLVNEHEFGNGTSIYTRDGDVGRTFANKIKIGMVGINIPIPVPVAYHSFGGWKRSLFGDQHMHGPEGVRFYTKLKTITSKWPSGLRSDPDFVMPTMQLNFMKKKISLIGAGQIGGTLAHLITIKELADVVLFDVVEGIAKGKALDIAQSTSVEGFNINLIGTNNYEDTRNSDVIIITAGIPRKPGMTRDDLLETNLKIIKQVAKRNKKNFS